jgi:L-cysteine:1D-myo-inositol 2-amino-2-deoxy-alpha-D-glucopyranoside ligase
VQATAGLVHREAAYDLPDGRVYFDTGSAGERFGGLSRLDRPTMLAEFAEKGGDPEASGKRDALDFLLWQPSADAEPSWPSPYGPGRPGWHIECSVMAMQEMGNVIDIHGGGRDLIFPHHEAEILQAEFLTEQAPFSRFWAHTGMVALDGVKMSKSLGNLVFVSDLVQRVPPAAVRRMLLSHHYRSDWSYEESELQDAVQGVELWQAAMEDGCTGAAREHEEEFHAHMSNDLDVPEAIRAIDRAAHSAAGGAVRNLSTILGFRL